MRLVILVFLFCVSFSSIASAQSVAVKAKDSIAVTAFSKKWKKALANKKQAGLSAYYADSFMYNGSWIKSVAKRSELNIDEEFLSDKLSMTQAGEGVLLELHGYRDAGGFYPEGDSYYLLIKNTAKGWKIVSEYSGEYLAAAHALDVKYDAETYGLPEGAFVIEIDSLPAYHRKIVLWMQEPGLGRRKKYHNSQVFNGGLGDYYKGDLHISLLEIHNKWLLNTLDVNYTEEGNRPLDSAYRGVPFLAPQTYYHIPGARDSNTPGRPKLVSFKDGNGDGRPLEFVLYEADDFADRDGLLTSLCGYDTADDKIIQYPALIKGKQVYWLENTFNQPLHTGKDTLYAADMKDGFHNQKKETRLSYNAKEKRFEGRCEMIFHMLSSRPLKEKGRLTAPVKRTR